MNFDVLSIGELKDIQRTVNQAIASFEDRKRKEALAAIEAKAREFGFSVSDLTGIRIARTRTPATRKYANPGNASETWSGRGRKPKWFAEALAAGKTPDDLLV